jgi:hypothetical protein
VTQTSASTSAAADGGGVKVVPVIVPPWPGGGDGTATMRQDAPPNAPQAQPPVAQRAGPPGGQQGGPPPSASGDQTGGGPGAGSGSGGGAAADDGSGHGGGAEPLQYAATSPGASGKGIKWVILGAIAALVVVAVLVWPRIFGPTRTTVSPNPSGTISLSPSPTPTQPTTPTPSISTPTRPPIKAVDPLQALRTAKPLVIDGSTDDWQWQLVSRAEYQITDNRSAATGDIYLMWDDEALYLMANVADPSPRPPDPTSPSTAWRGDSVVLELGPDKSRLTDRDRARPTDAYYIFGYAAPGTTPTMAILGPNTARTDFREARDSRRLDAAVATTNTGWVLEAKIPWVVTGLNGIRDGAVLAANVQVSQRKPDSFANLGMMSTNPQRTLQVRMFPAYWQALQLES